MKTKKELLTRIDKSYFNPKFHHANIKAIMGSLKGTKYYSRENAERLMKYREDGWRWNIVEDAVDEAHLEKCRPIIDKIIKEQEEEWQLLRINKKREDDRIKNLKRRQEEEDQYMLDLKQLGAEGYYDGFLVKEILKYLNSISSSYGELKIALMTIEHYQVKKKYSSDGKSIDESWVNDVTEIIEKIQTDKVWLKKLDAIYEEIHGVIDVPLDILDGVGETDKEDLKIDEEENYESDSEPIDDYHWLDIQREMSDDYNNRGVADGTRYYCDLDDIDDCNREEY